MFLTCCFFFYQLAPDRGVKITPGRSYPSTSALSRNASIQLHKPIACPSMLDAPLVDSPIRHRSKTIKLRTEERLDLEDSVAPAHVDSPRAAANLLAKRGLRIGRTRVGKGLFATKRIVDGSCIGEIHGQVINDDDYVSRYAFDLNDGHQLEPAAPFRFVNHSCEPNCAFECFAFSNDPRSVSNTSAGSVDSDFVSGHRRLLLFAICDIAIGQELTIDYNWPAVFAIPCACGSSACRGWIVTPKDLPLVLADLA
jgi:hypothetical protein